jgi:shikimate dehydrogenase
MHQAALLASDLPGVYEPLEIESANLGQTVKYLFDQGYRGLNVTVPHKVAVRPFLLDLSPKAEAVGSVNTLIRLENGFYGDNTDCDGFIAAYGQIIRARNRPKTLILGAGGAARAVAAACGKLNLETYLSSRSPAPCLSLAETFGAEPLLWLGLDKISPFEIIINTTSASSATEFEPAPAPLALTPGGLVIDINYAREDNYFTRLASHGQGKFLDGLPMLAHQAKLSFTLWTGRDPGIDVFLDVLKARYRLSQPLN